MFMILHKWLFACTFVRQLESDMPRSRQPVSLLASEPPLARAPFPQLAWEKNLFISAPGTDQSYRTKQASELPL